MSLACTDTSDCLGKVMKISHFNQTKIAPFINIMLELCYFSLGQLADMEFVKNFTPPDFQVKNFTPSISLNFNSFGDKNTKMSGYGEI